jgi:dihydrolipoamide dehydrogenase
VATGSKISKVNIPGIDLPVVMNSTDALSCTELPKSITIIGGGVIGMEFAFIYRNLGVNVHVVEFMDRLLTMMDHDISEELRRAAEVAGIHIHVGAKVSKIQRADDGHAIVTYETQNGEHFLVSEKVLVAIGREPNMDGLEIEKAGVLLNDRGRRISVDNHMHTNVEHIYAIGDVTNIMQLAHVASHQGITAVDAILGENSGMHYTAVPNVIFTSPEISSVGLLESECQAREMDYSVSKVSFDSNGKGQTMNESDGYIKLIKDNCSGKIVGGSIIGPDASSLISSLTMAIANELTEQQITQTIFAHPTTAEVLHEAAYGLSIGALHQA